MRFRPVLAAVLAVLALLVAAVATLIVGCKPSAEKILGCPLPPTTKDVQVSDTAGPFGGDYYLSAAMSETDFSNVVSQLRLRHRPDLLDYWIGALDAQRTPWWSVAQTNDQFTFFGEEESTFLVARYENGRLYFKRHVY